jgi:hypothetical protein
MNNVAPNPLGKPPNETLAADRRLYKELVTT